MFEVQSEIQAVEETREDFDNFGYNLMDCSSCLLVKMGEKANYSGMLQLGDLRPDFTFKYSSPGLPCEHCGNIQRSPYD